MLGAYGPQAALIRFSIRFRGVVIALACVLLGYGLYTLLEAKYDVFPEFAPPQIAIQTEAPGLAPEQVEILVTQPLENVINGVPGLRTLQSSSIQGLSVITATFGGCSTASDRRRAADHDAADLLDEHGARCRTQLAAALANGPSHDCRMDDPPAAPRRTPVGKHPFLPPPRDIAPAPS